MTLFARCLFALSALSPFTALDFQGAQREVDVANAPAVEYLFFDATWCGPCDQMRPIVERLNDRGYEIRIVDIDRQPEVVKQYKIIAIPALVGVVDGKAVNRRVGHQNEKAIENFIFQTSRSARISAAVQTAEEKQPEPGIPGAVKVESLLRVTYDVPEAKANALVSFLEEHSTADFTAEVENGTLRITAAPEVQKALGPFVQTVLKR